MEYHGVHLLRLDIDLDGLTTICIATRLGLFLSMWLLHDVLFRVILEYFTLCRRVPGAMYQSCFVTGWMITQMDCMICLDLSSAYLIGVGWQGGFYPITFPAKTGTVSI